MDDDRMTADEARRLLAGMTPGTLEVAVIRDGRLADAGPQELAVVIHDDARAHQKDDGTWHSVIVCRGMDGPTRDANAAAFAAVKRALATVAAHTPDAAPLGVERAASPDVAAIEARAAAATWRVVCAGEWGGDVRKVTVHPPRPDHIPTVDGGAYRVTALDGQARGHSPRHAIATLAGDHGWDVAEILAPGEPTRAEAIAAALADSDARVAAAVAAERSRAVAMCREEMALWAGASDSGSEVANARHDVAATLADAIAAPTGGAQ
jgi:hypothetical protein